MISEVAFVGKAPGSYLMLLGGGYHGQRLNKIYRGKRTVVDFSFTNFDIYSPFRKRYGTRNSRYPETNDQALCSRAPVGRTIWRLRHSHGIHRTDYIWQRMVRPDGWRGRTQGNFLGSMTPYLSVHLKLLDAIVVLLYSFFRLMEHFLISLHLVTLVLFCEPPDFVKIDVQQSIHLYNSAL